MKLTDLSNYSTAQQGAATIQQVTSTDMKEEVDCTLVIMHVNNTGFK